ncbi:hypothetical protein [Streptomyces sp. JJ36]|uniref:hypothetical protein n=1 Tax=Streptomyces sp. JJ36 TaxID=2736645 RepID=UPI001F402052|nr:hypothetical protein [Streptomyces sp. JJ36]MCF6526474.1 hypothetical protein [Streptomyces sp. JJ36]
MPEERERTTTPEAAARAAGPAGAGKRRPARLRGPALWAAGVAASYGLLLTLRSDTFFFLAVPGVLGLVCLVGIRVVDGLTQPVGGAAAVFGPAPGEGAGGHRALLRLYRRVLLRRYAVLAVLTALFLAVPAVLDPRFLFPFFGVGVVCLVTGAGVLLDQARRLRRCARVLAVYDVAFRRPVQQLEKRPYGRRFLRIGGTGSDLPKMSAHTLTGRGGWPEGIADGVWFAGDDPFGGVLVVPGNGELMCMQPLDWDALAGERAQADAERRARAERAGLHTSTM